jgi:hypothetical protein
MRKLNASGGVNANPKNLTAEATAEADHFAAVAGPFLSAGTLQPALDLEDGPGGGLTMPKGKEFTPQQIETFVNVWVAELREDLPQVPLNPFIYTELSIAQRLGNNTPSLSQYPLWLVDTKSIDPVNAPDPRLEGGLGPWSDYSVIQYFQPKTKATPTNFDLDLVNPNQSLGSFEISTGTFSAEDSSFNQVMDYTFTATTPDEAISASIPGADGDETATVNATFASASLYSLTPVQNSAFGSISDDYNNLAAGQATAASAFASGASPFNVGVTSATWVSAALQAVSSADANTLTQDPPDANFTAIARPARPVTTILSHASDFKGLKTAGALASSINALELNEEKLNNLIVASTTTSNRIDGAVAAGNTRWAARQSAVLKSYAKQESALLASQSSLSQRESVQLTKAGVGSMNVAASDVQNFEQGVLDNGLPAAFVSVLNKLGISQSLQTSIQQALFVQDTDTASGSYASILTNATLESDLKEAGLLLKNG